MPHSLNTPTAAVAYVGHSRGCLANAVIAAVENLRDDYTTCADEAAFRAALAAGPAVPTLLEIAEGYLSDGLMTCRCAVATCPISHDHEAHLVSINGGPAVTCPGRLA